jgi:hypothetical protein
MTYGRVLKAGCGLLARWRGRKSFGRAGEGRLSRRSEGPLIRPFGPPSPVALEARLRHDGEKGPCGHLWRISSTTLILVVLSLLALHTHGATACTVPEGFARLSTPEAEIAYRWEPGTLKVGQFFAAEVIACRVPGAGAVREIVLDAQMPAHGHGMNYRPTVTSTGPGRFRVAGLMLHMPGMWRLTFDLVQGDKRTRLTQEVILEP